MNDREGVEERLRRLAGETDAVSARSDFDDRVMRAIEMDAGPSWVSGVLGSARALLPMALAVSVVAVVWAWTSDLDVDDSYAVSYDAVEVDF